MSTSSSTPSAPVLERAAPLLSHVAERKGTLGRSQKSPASSHFMLLLKQNYRSLFGPIGLEAFINATIVMVILLALMMPRLLPSLQPFRGAYGEQGDMEKPTIYTIFGVKSYDDWPDANNPWMMFGMYLFLLFLGALTYAILFYGGVVPCTYQHVFADRFSGMSEVIQIYGVSGKTYFSAKLFSLWSSLFFIPALVTYLFISLLPSVWIAQESLDGSLKDQTLFGLVASIFAMGLFPVVAGLFFAAYMGLKAGRSQGEADAIKGQLGIGHLLVFVLYGFVELFFQQPASFTGEIVGLVFDRSYGPDRQCVSNTVHYPLAYVGTFFHFLFGSLLPGYTATKLWIDQTMLGVVLRQAHAQEANHSTQLPNPQFPSPPDARSVFWCAFTGKLRPESEAVYGVDTDKEGTFNFVTSQSASTWAKHKGVHYWLPVILDYVAALLNVVLWVWLFVRAARKEAAATGEAEMENAGKNVCNGMEGENGFALQLCSLSKSYDGKKFANADVSFAVKPGQIYALLGHNGAGKTTLMRQITAMVPPTSGDALINGRSVRHHPDQVRKFLAFCPQQNPMWPGYTLREHLQFFLTISGRNLDVLEDGAGGECPMDRMEKFAARLGLEEKLDTKCSDLSGGMKRRMWTLCALMQPKESVILLDEPTSGLDPQARRDFWLLLDQVCRDENRACVFSTHYLEEADVLAEEKVILSHGKVVARGTSAEMKEEFGSGFWITLQLDSENKKLLQEERGKGERSTAELLLEREALLGKAGRRFVGDKLGVRFVSKSDAPGKHLKCLVPFDSAAQIPGILDDLKQNGPAFGLDRRVTVEKTTLEEVFQAVGAEDGEKEELETARRVSELSREASLYDEEEADEHAQVPERVFHFWQQVKAVFLFRVRADARQSATLALISIAFIWGLAGTTPQTGNHVLTTGTQLTSGLFMLLSLLGGVQQLYSGRLREEREDGRLSHLLIHGVSKTAYTIGSFCFYLLPSLATMLLGFALASHCIWPPWTHAPAAMSGMFLWVTAVVYALDSTVFGALFGNIAMGVEIVYVLVGSLLPLVLFSSAWNDVDDIQPAKDEVMTSESQLASLGLFPGDGGGSGWEMSVGRTLATFQYGIIPMLFPHTGAAVFLSQGMKLERLVLWLHQYWKELSRVSGNSDDITFESATVQQRFQAGLKARMDDGNRRNRDFEEQKMDLVYEALFDEEWYGGRRANLANNLFLRGKLPDKLAKLFDAVTPMSETRQIAKRSNPNVVVREETVENRIRNKAWASAVEHVQYVHTMSFVGFFTGVVVRLVLFLGLLIAQALKEKSRGNKAGNAWSSAKKAKEVVSSDSSSLLRAGEKLEAGDDRDPDVLAEEKRVEEEITAEKAGEALANVSDVSVSGVTKKFASAKGDKWALNGVTFGVRSGEVFGLLGPNGAGKSTMFTLLSGNWDKIGGPTEGEIRILQQNVTELGFADAYKKMGIVPQFDKHLFPYASAQQHLELYMVVKNRPGQNNFEKRGLIEKILREVGLDPDNHQPVGQYSGGMMRKLSFALSLVTDPQVLLLDEVSGGVDIVSQRLLWKKMSLLKPENQTIITASHSMSEVEAVCDRVGIMVGGELQCLGSTSRVKEVHGNVCQLEMYCSPVRGDVGLGLDAKVGKLRTAIAQDVFGGEKGAELGRKFFVLEQHAFSQSRFRVVFGVDRGSLDMGKLFAWCWEDRLECIDDFMIGEPTIEQIFLKFAAKQEALDEAEGKAA